MAGELSDWGDNLAKILTPEQQRKMIRSAGMAAKKVANDAAPPLSNARRYGGLFGRKPTAGFDETGLTTITVNHRPGSLWSLMDSGRAKSGPLYHRINQRRNKTRLGAGAVWTPQGYRARSSYGPSRPPHPDLISKTFGTERRVAHNAAKAVFTTAIGSAIRTGRRIGSVGSVEGD